MTVQAVRRANQRFVPSLKRLATIHNARRKTPNKPNDPNAASDSNVRDDPNPPRIGLGSVLERFTKSSRSFSVPTHNSCCPAGFAQIRRGMAVAHPRRGVALFSPAFI